MSNLDIDSDGSIDAQVEQVVVMSKQHKTTKQAASSTNPVITTNNPLPGKTRGRVFDQEEEEEDS